MIKIMMLNENEWCQAMFGRDSHKSFKEYIFECYEFGDPVKEISKVIGKSKSTVYRYIQEVRDNVRYPILKNEVKIALQGDFNGFIENLSYQDICLIRREFGLSGYDKETKIKAIIKYFKDFSILRIFPEDLTKLKIKLAFRQRAKSTHPDLNKTADKFGKEFQEVYRVYTELVQIYV